MVPDLDRRVEDLRCHISQDLILSVPEDRGLVLGLP